MSVEVKLELGHRAILRESPTLEGFTHDWTVFVKGAEGGNIHNFVDKVVFHLHESFHKPRRVVKEPPYHVSESGYAGFIMPIEVYFRSKEEPKKVRFEYDLYLRLEGAPVSNIRLEKLTFQNPSDDFRRKLLKAGGVGALSASTVPGGASLQTQACAPIQHTEEHRPPSHSKPSAAVAEKKPRHHSAIKEPSKPPPPPPPVSKGSQPFTEIFGVPIKTKHSPDSTGKIKESGLSSSHQKQSKVSPPRSSSVGNKEPKSISKESHTSDIKEHKPLKTTKGEKEFKSSSKRPLAIDNQSSSSHEKKRKHGSLLSENGEKTGDIVKAKDRKEKHKNRTASHSNKKDKTKNKLSTTLHQNKDISKPNSQVHKEVSPEIHSHETDSNDSKDMSHKFDHNPKSPVLSETSPNYCNPRSPSITISPLSSDTELSPPHAKEKLSNNGHEVEENFFEDKTPEKPAVKSDKNILKPKTKSKLKPPAKVNHANENCVSKENNDHSISLTEETNIHQESTTDQTCIAELKELQRRIMSIEDKQLLQRVVDIIEETGSFQISKTSFDFDLLKLDQNTVHKLKHLTL